MGFETELT